MRRPEVLAPAGDRDALAAALTAGADAIYLGLDDGFNARARAVNFASDTLPEIAAWVHRAGARLYVTLNTLIFEPELATVEELIRRVAAAGTDAIIVQDPAVALIARATCPALEVHASTQMTATSPLAVTLLAPLGLSRVVVPRELSVDEIRAYAAASPIPLEVFVHGALCVAWSGQCLSSEAWGGRSANRGQCAQACRLPYSLIVDGTERDLGEVEYLLSPKDLVGTSAIPALTEIGVASFKIEGRLKGPHYVATTVAHYRNAIASALGIPAPATPIEIPDDDVSVNVTYSRGISPGFLSGADHQSLVEGRFPRHRGLPLGRVVKVDRDAVFVVPDAAQRPNTGGLGMESAASSASSSSGASSSGASSSGASSSGASSSGASSSGASASGASASSGTPGAAAPRVSAGTSPVIAPRAGMGVVFDAGRPEDPEQGGPIFSVDAIADGYRLRFGTPGPDLSHVHAGDFVWISSDPKVTRAGEKAAEAGRSPLGRIGVELVVRGAVGEPLEVVARAIRAVAHEPPSSPPRSSAAIGRDVLGTASARTTSTLQLARGAGLSSEVLADKLGGFGGTDFHLERIDTTGLASGLHVPVSELKEVRRAIVADLDAQIVRVERVLAPGSVLDTLRASRFVAASHVTIHGAAAHDAAAQDAAPMQASRAGTTAPLDTPLVIVPLVRNDEQLDAVLAAGANEVELDWMELVGLAKAVARAKSAGAKVGVATVRVQKPGEERIDAHLARLEPDWVLVRSWGSLAYFTSRANENDARANDALADVAPRDGAASPTAIELHGDFSLNVTNSITASWVLGHGLTTITAAHDLDRDQLLAMLDAVPRGRVAVTVHHHIPTFHTEHCVYAHLLSKGADYRTCGRPCEEHAVSLRDRVGLVHPVIVDVGCRNTVFNAQAQSAASLVPELVAKGVRRMRIEMVRESALEARRLFDAYSKLGTGEITPADVVKRAEVHEQFGVTRGTMRTLTVLR